MIYFIQRFLRMAIALSVVLAYIYIIFTAISTLLNEFMGYIFSKFTQFINDLTSMGGDYAGCIYYYLHSFGVDSALNAFISGLFLLFGIYVSAYMLLFGLKGSLYLKELLVKYIV